MGEAVDKLREAVDKGDADAALRLLESAGGACQARELAQGAHAKNRPGNLYSIVDDKYRGIETLTVYDKWFKPLAGITQDRCEK